MGRNRLDRAADRTPADREADRSQADRAAGQSHRRDPEADRSQAAAAGTRADRREEGRTREAADRSQEDQAAGRIRRHQGEGRIQAADQNQADQAADQSQAAGAADRSREGQADRSGRRRLRRTCRLESRGPRNADRSWLTLPKERAAIGTKPEAARVACSRRLTRETTKLDADERSRSVPRREHSVAPPTQIKNNVASHAMETGNRRHLYVATHRRLPAVAFNTGRRTRAEAAPRPLRRRSPTRRAPPPVLGATPEAKAIGVETAAIAVAPRGSVLRHAEHGAAASAPVSAPSARLSLWRRERGRPYRRGRANRRGARGGRRRGRRARSCRCGGC